MGPQALILFAKFPRPGEVKTRLGEVIGMDAAAEVYRQFAAHTFALAQTLSSAGVEVFVFYAPGATESEMVQWVGYPFRYECQQGKDLGERIHNAFDTVFRHGASQCVLIGTDVPEMDLPTLNASFSSLAAADVVVGPSTDGGYYLLGMHANTKSIFADVPWSTNEVFHRTLDHIITLQLHHCVLPVLNDIDTAADYLAYLERKKGTQA